MATIETASTSLPRVVVVGRMNVGKSTLFNRLAESRRALVSDIPGTTRDTNEAEIMWRGKRLLLVDTGGFDVDTTTAADRFAVQHAHDAVRNADVVLFVVDGLSPCLSTDRQIAAFLRTLTGTPILVVANKIDTTVQRSDIDPDYLAFGFGQPIPVSARTGRMSGDLLDDIVEHIGETPETGETPPAVQVGVIGRPNAGKSSVINMLVKNEAAIVSDEPLTTRESHQVTFSYHGQRFAFIDTAGLRRPSKIRRSTLAHAPLERESARQSIGTATNADIIFLVLDVTDGPFHQDQRLAAVAVDSRASIIIVANKIDLVTEGDIETLSSLVRSAFPMIAWAPIVLTSTVADRGRMELLSMAELALDDRYKRLTEEECTDIVSAAVAAQLPTRGKGTRFPKIHSLTQTRIGPPAFEMTIGVKQDLSPSYVRFVERLIREHHGFLGTPISIVVRHS